MRLEARGWRGRVMARPDRAAALAMLAMALVALWPLAWRPAWVPFPPGAAFTDLLVSHWPNVDYVRQSLALYGRAPLWNSQLFAGQPFAADPLAGLWYPPGWLLFVLPLPFGFNLLFWLHLAWAGLGVYRLLRDEAVAHQAALLGGLAFAGTPKLVAHVGAGHVSLVFAAAWTPWLLLAVRRLARDGGAWPGTLAGATLALIFLADVRWAFYAAVLAVADGLHTWLRCGRPGVARGDRRVAGRYVAGLLAAIVVAGLLSAGLALPLAEFVGQAGRAALTLEEAAVFSLPPLYLLGLLIPDLGGFHEWMTYVGVVVLLLAVAGIGRRTLFWLAVVAAAGAFALGSHFALFPLLYRVLPGLSLLRVPPRAWFLVALGLCVLAGHGLQALAGYAWPRLQARYGGRLPPARAVVAAACLLVALDLWRVDQTLIEARPRPAAPAAAAWLRQQPGPFRVYSPSYSLPPGLGLEHVDGVDPLQIAAVVDFIEPAAGVVASGYSVTVPAFESGDPATANRAAVPDAARLGLLNVGYVAAEFPLASPALELVERFGSTYLYANAEARPRAWLEAPAAGAASDVELLEWSPDAIRVRARGPGRLVLSEIMYPGWIVVVDGAPAKLQTAHGVLRAVDLPAGEHEVRLVYRPASVYIGGVLALLGAALLLGLGAREWRSRRAG